MVHELGVKFKNSIFTESVRLLCAHQGMSARDAVGIVAEVINAIEDIHLEMPDEDGGWRLSFYAHARQ